MLVDSVEELLDAFRAEGLVPVLTEGRLMVVRHDGVVGVEGKPDARVMELRELIEGDRADPVEGARRAVDGGKAVARLAQRHDARAEKADVAGRVGIDDVRRPDHQPRRGEEVVPGLHCVEAHEGLDRRISIGKSAERQGNRLAGGGEARESWLTSETTGPWRVVRTVSFTSAPPLTRIVSSRFSNGFGPSGVRYFEGSEGSTVSTNRSATWLRAAVKPQAA